MKEQMTAPASTLQPRAKCLAWDPGGKCPAAGRRGVIYRIHRPKLDAILARASELSRTMSEAEGVVPAPELFLVDIRDVPSSFARRPAAQRGASLYGFDQAIVIAAAFKGSTIEAFEFEHRPGLDIGISREDVVPTQDPFLPKLERFRAFRDAITAKAVGEFIESAVPVARQATRG